MINFNSTPIFSDSEDERQEKIFSGVMTRQRQREQEQEQTGVVDEAVQEDLAARTQTKDNFYMANAANMNRTLGILSAKAQTESRHKLPGGYRVSGPRKVDGSNGQGNEFDVVRKYVDTSTSTTKAKECKI